MAKSNILNFKVTIGTSTCKFNKYLLFLLTCMVKAQLVKNTFIENGTKTKHCVIFFLLYATNMYYFVNNGENIKSCIINKTFKISTKL